MALIHVKGLEELNRYLQELPPKLEKNVLRGAMRAGANVLLAQARNNVPVGPPGSRNAKLYGGYAGALRDSLRVSVNAKAGTVTAKVIAGGKKRGADTYYAAWVEYGTRPHVIKSKTGIVIGGQFAGKSVQHPGASPRPFMRPALDTQASAAVVAAGQYIAARLATKNGLDTADIVVEAV